MKVLFTNNSFDSEELGQLKRSGIDIVSGGPDLSESELIDALEGCDGYVIGGTDRATQAVIQATNLKVIVFYGAGYQDYIDMPTATLRQIKVANTPKANAYTVAEHTVGLILEAVKNTTWLNNTTKRGEWNRRRTWNLQGKTLGIVGMGTIGKHVAKIMNSGFNMNVVYTNRTHKLDNADGIIGKHLPLTELMKVSDVISIHASLNEDSTNMITAAELSMMQKHAVLINVSRAKIVNGNDLKQALNLGHLAKAVFDGYYTEPVSEQDEIGLLSLPDDKFVITPHTAYNTKEAFDNMNAMVIENLIAFAKRERLPYQVN